ncbi:putative xylanase/chitin deacetylase [Owenweeksia hongkongensis DSM 17368]|uniref:Putative xylanase/chitin deacetylase n=1 Tax=Owenweeksia hongkongensis (strain DSM 17368 / CIP 108786 / JCM 12287 / NRRL B-23963 / UST20020801) TaxID=926562 RepID=G8R036_OWEHD|nr:polysaccharide deacetylase family protein [Owenweeksia hongkongensis]AEV33702.1 putative xylanase/chitin deacetylase [Owenweeksia hongkongensis DSM 17368]
MRNYLIKSPWWLRAIYPNLTWEIPAMDKVVYLTFDDGPTPEITNWVIEQLAKHQALGTFFLIGKNVADNPSVYQQLKDAGHSIGNHTSNHLNGWKHTTKDYLENVKACQDLLADTKLFRPPYGRIKKSQAKALKQDYNIIMWDILSGDFDTSIDGERCYQNVVKHIQPGSIIVFHDSVKAWPRLQIALPKTLEYLKEKGFRMEAL